MRKSYIDKNTSYCEEWIYTPKDLEVSQNATLYHDNKRWYYVKLRLIKNRKRYLKEWDVFQGKKSKTVIKIQSNTKLAIYDSFENCLWSVIYRRN